MLHLPKSFIKKFEKIKAIQKLRIIVMVLLNIEKQHIVYATEYLMFPTEVP